MGCASVVHCKRIHGCVIQLAHAVHRPCPSIYVCGNKVVIVTIIIKRGVQSFLLVITFFSEKGWDIFTKSQVRKISLSPSLSSKKSAWQNLEDEICLYNDAKLFLLLEKYCSILWGGGLIFVFEESESLAKKKLFNDTRYFLISMRGGSCSLYMDFHCDKTITENEIRRNENSFQEKPISLHNIVYVKPADR